MPLPDSRRDELAAWLRLVLTPGIGPKAQRDLLGRIGLPEEILSAPVARLATIVGETPARALARQDARREALVRRSLDWAGAADNHLLTLTDPRYPAALLEIADPPVLLHVRGSPDRLNRPALAIVGSRSCSLAGRHTAQAFASALGGEGFAIVSGLAAGIDAAAHRGALDTAGGTIAVLGTGADEIYPVEHTGLADAIVAAGGALVSELALGTTARRSHFPRRNRIIAGLSRGVLVVEAAVRSGSLITARLAADFGREVMAIPGSIHSPLSRGCHQLIKQGAKLVEDASDILTELPGLIPAGRPDGTAAAGSDRTGGTTASAANIPPCTATAATSGPTSSRSAPGPLASVILETAGWAPFSAESIARRCIADGLAAHAGEIAAQLLALEFSGTVERLVDGRYQQRPGA